MKEQLTAGLSEGQIAEFVENDEVHAREIFGEPPLPAGAGFALQPIDEVDDGVEVAPGAAADAGPRDSYRQMRLAGSTDQHGIALFGQKAPLARSRISTSLTGVPVKSKSPMSLASGSLAIVSWYLIERACFSAISALSRSPTIRDGSCRRLMPVVITSSYAARMP